tara:strand:- start:11 stop:238 length:228 start_codon:yes stop_codon:yes gene_type:complete
MTLFENNTYKGKTGKVLNHLQQYKSITSWEAITLYRATRLSAIIYRLKQDGFDIRSKNISENGMNFSRYEYIGGN